jgi:hypothetical protein
MKNLAIDTDDVSSVSALCTSEAKQSDSTKITPKRYTGGSDLISIVSRISEKEVDETDDLLDEILTMLQHALTKDCSALGKASVAEAADTQRRSLVEKLVYTKALVTSICSSYFDLPTNEANSHASIKLDIKRRPRKAKSVMLSKDDCKVLCELLASPPPQRKDPNLLQQFAKLECQCVVLGQKLLESQAQLRKKEDESEYLIETNMSLRSSCKVMRQQIRSLERQLVDSFAETYALEDSYKTAMAELANFRAFNSSEITEGRSWVVSLSPGVVTSSFNRQTIEATSFTEF